MGDRVFYSVTSRRMCQDDSSLLSEVLRDYFEKGSQHGKKVSSTFGTDTAAKYSITRGGFKWELVSGGRTVQRSYLTKNGCSVVTCDAAGELREKTDFDRHWKWKRTSYFRGNPKQPEMLLTPSVDGIDCLRYDRKIEKYRRRILVPYPVEENETERARLDNVTGIPDVEADTNDGLFYYCPVRQRDKRRVAAAGEKISEKTELGWNEVPESPIHFDFVRNEHALEEATAPHPDFSGESEAPVPVPQFEIPSSLPMPTVMDDCIIIDTETPDEPAVIEEDIEPKPVSFHPEEPEEEKKPEPEKLEKSEEPLPEKDTINVENDAEQPAAAENNEQNNSNDEPQLLENEETDTAENPELLPPEPDISTVPPEALLAVKQPSPSKEIKVSENETYLYYGSLKDGQRSGSGRTQMTDGHTAYEGGFAADKRDGFGTYYYKSGRLCYVGNWQQNKRTGLGVSFSARDGSLFVGTWQDNAPTGRGAAFDADGSLSYYGMWLDGKRDGQGTEYVDGRILYEGRWRGDCYSGTGCLYAQDGSLLCGEFKKGFAEGECEERDAAGATLRTGVWQHGKFVSGVRYENGKPKEIVVKPEDKE